MYFVVHQNWYLEYRICHMLIVFVLSIYQLWNIIKSEVTWFKFTKFSKVKMNHWWKALFDVDSTSITRGYKIKIKKSFVKNKVRKHFFSTRTINDWSSLPSCYCCQCSAIRHFWNRIGQDMVWQKVRISSFNLLICLEMHAKF